jgi:hypothetical protein
MNPCRILIVEDEAIVAGVSANRFSDGSMNTIETVDAE